MKSVNILCVCLCILLSGHLCAPISIVAQLTQTSEESVQQAKTVDLYQKTTIATLRKILISTRELRKQIEQRNEELKVAESAEQQLIIRKKIQELYERLEDLENDFESVATGVDLSKFTDESIESFDWQEEMQDLIKPIIDELKSLTARPRELEKLRNDVVYYEKRLLLIEKALSSIQKNLESVTAALLKKELLDLQTFWKERYQEFTSQLATAQRRLDDKLAIEQSVVRTVQTAFRNFFKSRGLNLFLSLLAFIGVFLLMMMLQRFIYKTAHLDKSGKRPFYIRLAGILYYIFTFLAATTALLLVLYMSGDWVLLGLALIFLFGVAWTGKQALPRLWEQIKVLLNLSTVREGERVIYQGLPWKVLSLNIYTKLHNPELKGGMIRLPLGELLGLHSRPFHKNEPWFPCQEGDFVLLSDGTYGKILMQTPESVQLLTFRSRKTYLTPYFLQLSPINLSSDFTSQVTFGIDYQHQAIVTQEVPTILKTTLSETLQKQGYGADILSLNVEFKEAGASSLDLAILAEFSGRVAKDYYALSRSLQRIAVDACNQHNWIIPFTQITLHTGNTSSQDEEKGKNIVENIDNSSISLP